MTVGFWCRENWRRQGGRRRRVRERKVKELSYVHFSKKNNWRTENKCDQSISYRLVTCGAPAPIIHCLFGTFSDPPVRLRLCRPASLFDFALWTTSLSSFANMRVQHLRNTTPSHATGGSISTRSSSRNTPQSPPSISPLPNPTDTP